MLKYGLLLAVVFLSACGQAPPAYQGVVACDEETLAFEVAGTLATTRVEEGQHVEPGSLLMVLDSRTLLLVQAQAEAELRLAERRQAALMAPARPQDLAVAEADLVAAVISARIAESDQTRIQDLSSHEQASEQDRDRAINAAARSVASLQSVKERLSVLKAGATAEDLAVAQAQVALAGVTLERAKERVARSELHAPGSRLIRHLHLRPGEVAQPGTPAITLADSDRPYVDAFVRQADLAALRVGGVAHLRIDGIPAISGVIERIGERLEFTPRYLFGPHDRPDLVARVRIRLPRTDGLHAGVPADVTFGP